MDFAVLAAQKVKIKENEKRDKYLDLPRQLKKLLVHESDGDTNHNWCVQKVPKRFGNGSWKLVDKPRPSKLKND